MSALHIYGILIIALGTVIGSYLIYLGNSKDSKKESDDIKQKIERAVDINTINEEAQKFKPNLNVITKYTINKTNQSYYLDIFVEAKNIQPKSIAIDYPLKGVVGKWNDLNTTTNAELSTIDILGDSSGISVNNINILIKNITLDRKLTYRFFFTPTFSNAELGGRDIYETTYKWQYKGIDYSETEWRTVEKDEITDQPDFRTMNTTVYNRVLTPEEIKKLFEEGLNKRK